MDKRFTYSKMDKIVENSILTHGKILDPERRCDNCKNSYRASELYALTPLDFKEWLNESPNLDTLKKFGLVRCQNCLPKDAVSSEEYFKSARGGWQHSAQVHSKEREQKDTERLSDMVADAMQKFREKDTLEFNRIAFLIQRRFDLAANIHSEKNKADLNERELLERQAGSIIKAMEKTTLLHATLSWDELDEFR